MLKGAMNQLVQFTIIAFVEFYNFAQFKFCFHGLSLLAISSDLKFHARVVSYFSKFWDMLEILQPNLFPLTFLFQETTVSLRKMQIKLQIEYYYVKK